MKSVPTAGDIVICTSGEMLGKIGVILGERGQDKNVWRVCFEGRPFFDGEHVASSGGISFEIDVKSFRSTGKRNMAKFEMCRAGYNGIPNGQIHEEDVSVWSYYDDAPHGVFSGVFSIEEIASRRKADYEFTEHAKSHRMFKFSKATDGIGLHLFEAAKRFDGLSLHIKWGQLPSLNEYRISSGINQIEVIRGRSSFEQLVCAYKLQYKMIDENNGVIIPNMNVSEWAPLGYRQLVA